MSKVVFEKIYSSGNEIAFMTDVVNFILGIDPRITCNTTVSEQYENQESSYVPKFSFSIDGKATLTITRNADLANYALAFTITCGSFSRGDCYFSTAWRNGGVYQNLYREFNIAAVVTDDVLSFTFAGGTSGNYYNINITITTITADSMHYLCTVGNQTYSTSSIFNLANSNRLYTELETATPGYFTSRFQYKSPTGKLDYANGAVCVNNGGKVFSLSSIYDCTELTPGTQYTLNNKEYFAIGPHQLVKIS